MITKMNKGGIEMDVILFTLDHEYDLGEIEKKLTAPVEKSTVRADEFFSLAQFQMGLK